MYKTIDDYRYSNGVNMWGKITKENIEIVENNVKIIVSFKTKKEFEFHIKNIKNILKDQYGKDFHIVSSNIHPYFKPYKMGEFLTNLPYSKLSEMKKENYLRVFEEDGLISVEGLKELFEDVKPHFNCYVNMCYNKFGLDKGDVCSFFSGYDDYIQHKLEEDIEDDFISDNEDVDLYHLEYNKVENFIEYYDLWEENPFPKVDFQI